MTSRSFFTESDHKKGRNKIKKLKERIQINAKDDFSMYELAKFYLHQSPPNHSSAIALLTTALKVTNDKFSFLVLRGKTYYASEQYEDAIADFHAAEKLNQGKEDVFHFRSLSYAALERYDEAISDVRKLILLEPSHTDVMLEIMQKMNHTIEIQKLEIGIPSPRFMGI